MRAFKTGSVTMRIGAHVAFEAYAEVCLLIIGGCLLALRRK